MGLYLLIKLDQNMGKISLDFKSFTKQNKEFWNQSVYILQAGLQEVTNGPLQLSV